MSRLPITREVRMASDFTLTVFEDLDVRLSDLHIANHGSGLGLTSDRTFRGCRVLGPAIMLVSAGVVFNECNFGEPNGIMANLILRPEGARALGTVPFRDTLFDGCEFFNVGFTGPAPVLEELLGVGKAPGVA